MDNKKINCLVVDDEEMSRLIISQFIEKTDFLQLCGSCSDAIQASQELRSQKIDLVFLDIQMPEMTGMEFLKNLKSRPYIVLITSNEKYAVEAFEYDVTDYLLKPVPYSRFLKAANTVRESIISNKPHNTADNIFIKVDSQYINLPVNDILYIEAMGDYVTVVTANKKHSIHSTMSAIISKLPTDRFVRIHRSYIINCTKISSLEESNLIIAGNILPVGSVYKNDLMNKLNIF